MLPYHNAVLVLTPSSSNHVVSFVDNDCYFSNIVRCSNTNSNTCSLQLKQAGTNYRNVYQTEVETSQAETITGVVLFVSLLLLYA